MEVQRGIFATCIKTAVWVGLFVQLLVSSYRRCTSFWQTPSRAIRAAVLLAMATNAYFHIKFVFQHPALYDEFLSHFSWWHPSYMQWLTHRLSPSFVDKVFGFIWLGLALVPLLYFVVSAKKRKKIVGILALGVWVWGSILCVCLTKPSVLVLSATNQALSTTSQPNILLIVVESMRQDHLTPKATPHLHKLAQKSVQFDHALVSLARTCSAWMTLLTGKYPPHHGVRTMFPTDDQVRNIGDTLPVLLHRVGYRTYLSSDGAGDVLNRGVDLGFDEKVVYGTNDMRSAASFAADKSHPSLYPYTKASSAELLHFDPNQANSFPKGVAWRLQQHQKLHPEQPFFHAVFLNASHVPFASSWPHYKKFSDPAYKGPHVYAKNPVGNQEMDKENKEQIYALYDGVLNKVDEQVGVLLEGLRELHLEQNTIVMVTADHGVTLHETSKLGVGYGNEMIGDFDKNVPLLVYDPTKSHPPHHVSGMVRTVDVLPTLLGAAGAQVPADVDGTDLKPLLANQASTLKLWAYLETGIWFFPFDPPEVTRLPYPKITQVLDINQNEQLVLKPEWQGRVVCGKYRVIQTDVWKLVYKPTPKGPVLALYNVLLDPMNAKNVLQEHPQEAEVLKQRLRVFLQADKNKDCTPQSID